MVQEKLLCDNWSLSAYYVERLLVTEMSSCSCVSGVRLSRKLRATRNFDMFRAKLANVAKIGKSGATPAIWAFPGQKLQQRGESLEVIKRLLDEGRNNNGHTLSGDRTVSFMTQLLLDQIQEQRRSSKLEETS